MRICGLVLSVKCGFAHFAWMLQNGTSYWCAMSSNDPSIQAAPAADEHSHDFDAQKQVHQQIRNDPDYDDWEYGTEPLPHEAWVASEASDANS